MIFTAKPAHTLHPLLTFLVIAALALSSAAQALTFGAAIPPLALPAAADSSIFPLAFLAVPNPSAPYQALTAQGAIRFAADRVDFDAAGIQLIFEGAGPAAQLTAGRPLEGVANYYIGRDPAGWRTAMPTYGEVRYQQLYPGIDLRYENQNGLLKGTYTVAPGADPSLIRWRYQGARDLNVDPASGNLLLTFGAQGRLVERAPVAWQEMEGRQWPVKASYVIEDGRVGFALGAYNPALPLIIDPVIAYSSYLAGSHIDYAKTIAVDGQGHAYIAGSTLSTNFINKPGASGAKEDVWVVKLNPAGSAWIYVTYLGGSDMDIPSEIEIDDSGNVYLTGTTASSNFPTASAAHPNQIGGFDLFAVKLNDSGGIVYSTYLGSNYTDDPGGIAVDGQGSVHIIGKILSGMGIIKLGSDGSERYSVYYRANVYGENSASSVVVNQAGEVIIAGQSGQNGLETTPNAIQSLCDGVSDQYRSCRGDVFILKLNNANSQNDLQVLYASYFGGKNIDSAEDIVIGPDGSFYLTGKTISSNYATTANAHARTCPSGVDPNDADSCLDYEAFILKLSADLSQVLYSSYYGGDAKDFGLAIDVDNNHSAYITGWTEGNDIPLVNQLMDFNQGICYTYYNHPRLCIEGFIAQFDANGALVFSTFLGGTNDDFANDLAVDSNGAVYVVGETSSINYPTTAGALQTSVALMPGRQGFVTKVGSGSNPPPDQFSHRTYLPYSVR